MAKILLGWGRNAVEKHMSIVGPSATSVASRSFSGVGLHLPHRQQRKASQFHTLSTFPSGVRDPHLHACGAPPCLHDYTPGARLQHSIPRYVRTPTLV